MWFQLSLYISISDVLLNDLFEAIMKSNVFVSATAEGAELSTSKRRKTFVRSNYPLVMPVQYTVGLRECTVVYVPVLQMLQAMFTNTDLNEKIQANPSSPGMYMSHEDGTYFKENQFLSEAGELKLSLILYMDDLEIANPLGTSRKSTSFVQYIGCLQTYPVSIGPAYMSYS